MAVVPENRRLQMDVGTSFSKLQLSRQETKSRPPIQDFQISLQDEAPVSMDMFEKIKFEREQEASRVIVQQTTSQGARTPQGQGPLQGPLQGAPLQGPL